MTTREWNKGIEYLMNSIKGDYVENEGRTVSVEDMCGGKFLLIDEDGEWCGVTNEPWRAMQFLKTGAWCF